jgi:hypothetical protein
MTKPPAFDEMTLPDGSVRSVYENVDKWLREAAADRLDLKRREADTIFRRLGITFSVYTEGGDPVSEGDGVEATQKNSNFLSVAVPGHASYFATNHPQPQYSDMGEPLTKHVKKCKRFGAPRQPALGRCECNHRKSAIFRLASASHWVDPSPGKTITPGGLRPERKDHGPAQRDGRLVPLF